MIRKLTSVYRQAYEGLPREAWLLSVVVLVNRSGSIVLYFMTLYLTRQHGFSVAAAGRMISIYGLGALAGSYLGGWLTDRIGHRVVMIYSLLLGGIGFFLLGYLKSPLALGLMLFAQGLVTEAFRPANSAALADACPPELRARGFALLRLAINAGVTIGPAAGGLLAAISYHLIFWVDGLTCLLAAIFLIVFIKVPGTTKEKSEALPVTGNSPWRDGIYLNILFLIFLSGLVFVQLLNSWPVYMKTFYGLRENRIGLLMGFNSLLVVLLEMPLVHRLEKYDMLKVIAVGALLLGVGFAILPAGHTFIWAALSVFIWTVGEMLVFPLLITFIANRSDEGNRGKYMGMLNLTFSLSFVAGPALGTWVYDIWSPQVLWLLCGVLGVVMCTGYWLVRRRC